MTHRPLQAGDRVQRRGGRPPRTLGPRAARVVAAALVVAMAVGALFMVGGVPVVWLWLASQFAGSKQPSAGLYALAGAGILLSMAGMGWVLSRLNRTYVQITGQRGRFVRRGWQRAEKGEHEPDPSAGVLDSIVVIAVVIALLAFLVWFFFFAGSTIDYRN